MFRVTYSAKGGIWSNRTVQEHSPLISGTFSMSLAGTPIQIYNSSSKMLTSNLPFNIESWTLREGFRRIPGL